MAASRATSLRTLSRLAASTSTRNLRQLHMTGPATFPSPLLTTEKPSFHKVQAAISAADAQDASQTASEAKTASTPSTRHFNTSRTLKSVNDTSTIDFAYLPDFDPDAGLPTPAVRVPLLPPSLYPGNTSKTSYTREEEEIVMRPEINLISADGTHITPPSAFVEVTDNGTIDFQGVAGKLREKAEVVAEDVGDVRRVWTGFLDDLLGAKGVGKV